MLTEQPLVLLTGVPGIGKSTTIKQALSCIRRPLSGFYTQEIRRSGERVGFESITLDGKRGILALKSATPCFPRETLFGHYRINLDTIADVIVPSLERHTSQDQLIVIDEIAPMSIASDTFCAVVSELVNDNRQAILGAIVQRSVPFADEVKQLSRLNLMVVNQENRDSLSSVVCQVFSL